MFPAVTGVTRYRVGYLLNFRHFNPRFTGVFIYMYSKRACLSQFHSDDFYQPIFLMWQTICFYPPVRGNHEPSKGELKFNVLGVHAVAVKSTDSRF